MSGRTSRSLSNSLRRIGRVRSVNPLRREVRVALDNPAEVLAASPAWLYFGQDGTEHPPRCKVESVKDTGEQLVAVLAAGVPRDTVAKLRGKAVFVTEAARPRHEGLLTPDVVLGMRVVQPCGTVVGVVAGVLEGPVNAVIRVERPEGGALLLPLVEPVVEAADLEARVLTVVADLTPYAVEES